jgi:hypothetical protein
VAVDQTAPEWKNESWDIEWTTGDTIDYDVRQHLVPGNDILHYTFEITSGVLPADLEFNNGIISGLISELQGGEYVLTVKATNPLGNQSSLDTLSIALVGLEITAPTLLSIPDFLAIELGASLVIDLNEYIDDDGDPASIQTLEWAIDGSSAALPSGFVLFGKRYIRSAKTLAEYGQDTIVVKVTNGAGFTSLTESFDMSVVDNSATAPTVTGAWTGTVSCGALAPVWGTVPDFTFEDDEVNAVKYNLNDYVNEGSSAITDISVNTGGPLATGLSLSSAGILGCDGSQVIAGAVTLTYSATNTTGTTNSGNSDLTVTAFPSPQIISISALDSSYLLVVNFSEAVTTAGTYSDGFTLTRNLSNPNLAIASGQGTSTLIFTSDELFTANNTLTLEYVDADGALESVANGSDYQVADADPAIIKYVVASGAEPLGTIFNDNFESGDLSATNADGFTWEAPNRTSIVTKDAVCADPGDNVAIWNVNTICNIHDPAGRDWTAKEGKNSLRLRYAAGVNWTEQRFYMGKGYPEIWVSYWIKVPLNFSRGLTGSPTNNKWFVMYMGKHSEVYSDPDVSHFTTQDWPGNPSTNIDVRLAYDNAGDRTYTLPETYADYITPADAGRWMHVVYHLKASSGDSATDGKIAWYRKWENESEYTTINDSGDIELIISQKSIDLGYNGWGGGYIMGYANMPYAEDTEWLLDLFKVSINDLRIT